MRIDVYSEIRSERGRQQQLLGGSYADKWDQSLTRNDWVAFICAYAGRASAKVLRNIREGQTFRENMIKVAALAVAAIEAYDKRTEANNDQG